MRQVRLDYKQIEITVAVGIAPRVRAKQDYAASGTASARRRPASAIKLSVSAVIDIAEIVAFSCDNAVGCPAGTTFHRTRTFSLLGMPAQRIVCKMEAAGIEPASEAVARRSLQA